MTSAVRLSPGLLRDIVRDAALAPSAHNVQAARWGCRDDAVALLRDPARTLPVGDPTGRDDRAGLGAALEGFALAAGARGLAIAGLTWGEDAAATIGRRGKGGLEVVAAFGLVAGAEPDPLAEFVSRRRTWRGPLGHDAAAMAALEYLRTDVDARDIRILDRAVASDLANGVDEATWAFERQPAYHRELWRWLRLDRAQPAYVRDGLTADAMLLSEPERIAARLLMRPGMFRFLQWTGLGKPLVSERAATRTAAGFVCYCPPATMNDYEVGRGLYRAWLAATRAGLVLAPMSAIVDHPPTRVRIESRLALAADRRLVQVFRAGTAPATPPRSPRIPVDELLIAL